MLRNYCCTCAMQRGLSLCTSYVELYAFSAVTAYTYMYGTRTSIVGKLAGLNTRTYERWQNGYALLKT